MTVQQWQASRVVFLHGTLIVWALMLLAMGAFGCGLYHWITRKGR